MRRVRRRFQRLPLLSSRKIVNALERLDCYEVDESASGSHKSYARDMPDGRRLTAIVVVGKAEVTRGTLRKILESLELDLDEFRKKVR